MGASTVKVLQLNIYDATIALGKHGIGERTNKIIKKDSNLTRAVFDHHFARVTWYERGIVPVEMTIGAGE